MIWNSVILGIVEGLTEFLPVSSTGHLIIVNKFISFTGEFANLFDVVIQIGAMFAVILYFRKDIFPFAKKDENVKIIQRWMKVALAFIPSAILGYLFADMIEDRLFNPTSVAIALIVGGILLLAAENYAQKHKTRDLDKVTWIDGAIIGIFQCLALFPGMSRSGSTLIGGFLRKLSRKSAAEFSFLLAIPTIFGASLFKLLKYEGTLNNSEIISLSVGVATSFIVAFFVIALFMNFIRTQSLKIFAYYRIILGAIVLTFLR